MKHCVTHSYLYIVTQLTIIELLMLSNYSLWIYMYSWWTLIYCSICFLSSVNYLDWTLWDLTVSLVLVDQPIAWLPLIFTNMNQLYYIIIYKLHSFALRFSAFTIFLINVNVWSKRMQHTELRLSMFVFVVLWHIFW